MGASHPFVKVDVPHVVDGAAGAAHEQRPRAEQREHRHAGQVTRVRRQCDRPRAGQVQQPRAYHRNVNKLRWIVLHVSTEDNGNSAFQSVGVDIEEKLVGRCLKKA